MPCKNSYWVFVIPVTGVCANELKPFAQISDGAQGSGPQTLCYQLALFHPIF